MDEYEVTDEDNAPAELVAAINAGLPIEVKTCIGWIAVEYPDVRCGVTYRIGAAP